MDAATAAIRTASWRSTRLVSTASRARSPMRSTDHSCAGMARAAALLASFGLAFAAQGQSLAAKPPAVSPENGEADRIDRARQCRLRVHGTRAGCARRLVGGAARWRYIVRVHARHRQQTFRAAQRQGGERRAGAVRLALPETRRRAHRGRHCAYRVGSARRTSGAIAWARAWA